MNTIASAVRDGGPNLVERYLTSAGGGYDELRDTTGDARRHWNLFIDGIGNLPPVDLSARAASIDRRVRETGIAYDMFADPNAATQ